MERSPPSKSLLGTGQSSSIKEGWARSQESHSAPPPYRDLGPASNDYGKTRSPHFQSPRQRSSPSSRNHSIRRQGRRGPAQSDHICAGSGLAKERPRATRHFH